MLAHILWCQMTSKQDSQAVKIILTKPKRHHSVNIKKIYAEKATEKMLARCSETNLSSSGADTSSFPTTFLSGGLSLADRVAEPSEQLKKICVPHHHKIHTMTMANDRCHIVSSFWMALVVCWAASTVVSSFQPLPATFQFQHFVKPGTFSGCGSRAHTRDQPQNQLYFVQTSVEACCTDTNSIIADIFVSENNIYLKVDDEQLESTYLSSREKYGNKTLDEAYQRQKQKWADRYTSVEALRETFGTNRNKLWGDLEAGTARRLYKTLLPRALLELSRVGAMQPEDLAPLAYQARLAAKQYTRERSHVPARLGATLYDGFRQWRTHGRFQSQGLTYEQLWEKYAKAIIQEAEHGSGGTASENDDDQSEKDRKTLGVVYGNEGDDDKSSVNMKVCQKILECACRTNDMVDNLFLKDSVERRQKDLLEKIHSQLLRDVYELLLPLRSAKNKGWSPVGSIVSTSSLTVRQFRTLRIMARAKQKFMIKQRKERRTERLQRQRQLRGATASIQNCDNTPWCRRERKRSDRSQRWLQRPQTRLHRDRENVE